MDLEDIKINPADQELLHTVTAGKNGENFNGNYFMRMLLGIPVLMSFIFLLGESAARADIKFGIASEPNPPFSSKSASGEWLGWEIDLMNTVCAQLNEKCELVAVAWDGLIPSLTSKKIDVIWSSMAITAERNKVINFTDMYYDTSTVIVGAKDGDMDISPRHLGGATIGVQTASTHEKYVKKHFVAGSEIKIYPTQDDAYSDLAAGRLDYVQSDGSTLDAFLKTDQGRACCEFKGVVPADPEILGQGVGGGVRKEDFVLKDKLNKAIGMLSATGKIEEITTKYPGLRQQIILPPQVP